MKNKHADKSVEKIKTRISPKIFKISLETRAVYDTVNKKYRRAERLVNFRT